ncbi:PIN domain-containing protein [Mesoaciditoga lauensis]|uniref:PIN domain-containing protein n=1 Tax=Mesoaciditoga lauensis TaxID=1495039 RepID=UPI00068DDE35|nr:PIN domain-containing protein [Mesoaciditoga lauensis]
MEWALALIPTLFGLYVGHTLHPLMGLLPGGVIGASIGVTLYFLFKDLKGKKVEPISFSIGLGAFMVFSVTGLLLVNHLWGDDIMMISIGKLVIVVMALLSAIEVGKRISLEKVLNREKFRNRGSFIFDTSALLEDKILDLFDIGLFNGRVIIPQFVLIELQKLADSVDTEKKEKGRKGFEIVEKIKKIPDIEFKIDDAITYEEGKVDEEIVNLARKFSGQIVTLDYNLTKMAQLQGVKVLNLNHLSEILKPTLLPGQKVMIQIIRRGKNKEQGIGFTEDGTMIVVEDGGKFVGTHHEIVITNILRTNAGKLLFGRINPK